MGLAPGQADAVQAVAIAVLVIAMMVSLGLKVRVDELGALVRRPRMLLASAAANLLAVPTIAFLGARALGVDGDALVAIVLCAAAPAGPAAALYSDTARADLPAAALLTIVLPAIGIVTTPLTVALCLGDGGDPFALALPMARTLVVFQVLPLAAAMLIRARAPNVAERAAPWATGAANTLLGVVAVALFVLKGHVLTSLEAEVWISLVGFAGVALLLGYVSGLPETDTARTGALVGLSRNVTVALLLAAAYFPRPAVDATVLSFALLALVGPLGLALWWRRRSTT